MPGASVASSRPLISRGIAIVRIRACVVGLFAAVVIAVASPAQAAMITLLPNTPLEGAPGATIGWGYDITNTQLEPATFIPTGAQILTGGIDAIVDTSIYDFPVIAPGASATQAYTGSLGLVALTLGNVPSGTVITGEVYGYFMYGDGTEESGPISLTFQATVVPEPATLLLFGGGLAGIAAGRLRRRA
jgi:hypothetical protein